MIQSHVILMQLKIDGIIKYMQIYFLANHGPRSSIADARSWSTQKKGNEQYRVSKEYIHTGANW